MTLYKILHMISNYLTVQNISNQERNNYFYNIYAIIKNIV